jgi:histone acetyltransferase (RNA polymerase elongator complex component)
MMTGLPGDTYEGCIATAKKIAELEPDCVRIYPTLVMDGTHLAKMYTDGTYRPQTIDEAVELVSEIIPIFADKNIDIIRIGLQTTDNVNSDTVIGPYHPAFAELCYGRIERNRIDERIVADNMKDCRLEISAPKNQFSKIIGHKKTNALYFKEKYNIDIVLKEEEI